MKLSGDYTPKKLAARMLVTALQHPYYRDAESIAEMLPIGEGTITEVQRERVIEAYKRLIVKIEQRARRLAE